MFRRRTVPHEPTARERGMVRRDRAVHGEVVPRPSRELDSPDDGLPSESDLEELSGVTQRCPACGTELYDDVEECWSCGERVGLGRTQRRLPSWAVITLMLVIAAWVIHSVGLI
jgi:hypothetical protein